MTASVKLRYQLIQALHPSGVSDSLLSLGISVGGAPQLSRSKFTLTTVVEARTWEVLVGLKWRDNDTLDVQLDFGCHPQMGRLMNTIGLIHIIYHWGDPGHVPKIGYETFRRRDLPPEPCP